ncbi:MAG: tRNA (adenosine(37)-N6)-dimethylallyltransferase MiaA [Phycisphaerae bacterium]
MMGLHLVIIGCTAAGKSELAEALAMRLAGPDGRPATIMAVDSMQVYRGMDIGTAKPSAAVRALIPHTMIDVADPSESFSAARFVTLAEPILEAHRAQERPLILVAGTILYLRALLEGLFAGPPANPQIRAALAVRAKEQGSAELHKELARVDAVAAQRIHPNDLRRIIRALEVFQITGCGISSLQTQWRNGRPHLNFRLIGVTRAKDDLNRRINQRVRKMMENGLLAEVRGLLQGPEGLSMPAREAVGYKQMIAHLTGSMPLDEAIEQIKIQTRHLAKLQRTWLKRFDGVSWLALEPEQPASELTGQILLSLAQQRGSA